MAGNEGTPLSLADSLGLLHTQAAGAALLQRRDHDQTYLLKETAAIRDRRLYPIFGLLPDLAALPVFQESMQFLWEEAFQPVFRERREILWQELDTESASLKRGQTRERKHYKREFEKLDQATAIHDGYYPYTQKRLKFASPFGAMEDTISERLDRIHPDMLAALPAHKVGPLLLLPDVDRHGIWSSLFEKRPERKVQKIPHLSLQFAPQLTHLGLDGYLTVGVRTTIHLPIDMDCYFEQFEKLLQEKRQPSLGLMDPCFFDESELDVFQRYEIDFKLPGNYPVHIDSPLQSPNITPTQLDEYIMKPVAEELYRVSAKR